MKIFESLEVSEFFTGECHEYISLSCRMSDSYMIEVNIYENDIEIVEWEDGEITNFIRVLK